MRTLEAVEAPAVAAEQAVEDSISCAHRAQGEWAELELAERLRIVRRLRNNIAESSQELCHAFSRELVRTPADSLTAEIMPLASACKYLEKSAARILATRRPRALRPLWLRGVELDIHREPFGVILVVGPANYPLFLPGVQTVQALVAGNAVVWKPGRGGALVARLFQTLAVRAGLPSQLLVVLGEGVENAGAAISAGIDKIVFTGSLETGRSVYEKAAAALTPVVMELSGEDPVFILNSADLERATDALLFGLTLNGGRTCIAPRRVFVWNEVADEFYRRLNSKLGYGSHQIAVTRVGTEAKALALAAESEYALGATIFGEPEAARALAAKLNAGVVVINDMIVPTADPRLPFGGRRSSGFGTTRGAEGLLEFTRPKAVALQRSKRLRHLEPHPANAEHLFTAFLAASHMAGWKNRFAAYGALVRAIAGTQARG
jgi:aldehyde dehydrogenase (NAD+)